MQVLGSDGETNPLKAAVQMHLKGRAAPSTSADPPLRVLPSSGWKRYTRDVRPKPVAVNALTMNDLSIFDGLKFADGEVIDLSQAIGEPSTLDDGEDVVDDDDDDGDDETMGPSGGDEDWHTEDSRMNNS